MFSSMNWDDLRVFLSIARSHTQGEAARSLGVSHPTVGRRLQALEQAVGQKLFQRSPEGLVLTEEGESVLVLAEQMEESALAVSRRLSGSPGEISGHLRIASSDWFGAWALPALLARYTRENPAVTVDLLTGTRLADLAHREADVAFRVVPFDQPDIVQRRLMTVRFGVYSALSFPSPEEGDGEGVTIFEDLATPTYPNPDWLKSRFPNARVAFRSNNRTAQALLAAEGEGLVLLPLSVGDSSPELRRISLSEEPPGRDLWIGYHADLRRLARLRAFLELAIEVLAD
ncbi:LysR family transcriptional regulator [Chromohalobacter sarecensis]|uniref:LysR family transcriptional regulator n=2 Tax=Chromohalobacter sarecensis TaxID=245294 RepID=A0ABV9D4F3_9GAMM